MTDEDYADMKWKDSLDGRARRRMKAKDLETIQIALIRLSLTKNDSSDAMAALERISKEVMTNDNRD